MSRRSRYARVHNATNRSGRPDSGRPESTRPRPVASPAGPESAASPAPVAPAVTSSVVPPVPAILDDARPVVPAAAVEPTNGHGPLAPQGAHPGPGPTPATNGHAPVAEAAGCTAPQLRRFIKSRTYVPMHELRRRFGINGTEDDVTLVDMDGRQIFVGLPGREGRLLAELLRGGDVGFELSFDPQTPIVVGVYPMRPVPRN
jgi:hypothetical protein